MATAFNTIALCAIDWRIVEQFRDDRKMKPGGGTGVDMPLDALTARFQDLRGIIDDLSKTKKAGDVVHVIESETQTGDDPTKPHYRHIPAMLVRVCAVAWYFGFCFS